MSGNCSLVNYTARDALSSQYTGYVGLLAVTVLLVVHLAKGVSFSEGRVNNLEDFCANVCLYISGVGGIEPGDLPAPGPLAGGAGVAGGILSLLLQDVLVAGLI